MKNIQKLLFLVILSFMILGFNRALAQCSVCSTTVESNQKNGGNAANGLNHGIMYLLAAPYLVAFAGGYIWYKKYRRKNVNIRMGDEKLNMN